MNIKTTNEEVIVENLSGGNTTIFIYNEEYVLEENAKIVIGQQDVVLA